QMGVAGGIGAAEVQAARPEHRAPREVAPHPGGGEGPPHRLHRQHVAGRRLAVQEARPARHQDAHPSPSPVRARTPPVPGPVSPCPLPGTARSMSEAAAAAPPGASRGVTLRHLLVYGGGRAGRVSSRPTRDPGTTCPVLRAWAAPVSGVTGASPIESAPVAGARSQAARGGAADPSAPAAGPPRAAGLD